jgi:hypothetical protein
MSDRSASSDKAPEVSRALAEYVAGIQFQRLPEAAVHPHSARRGFHNTPTAGVFGAAAGVSRLLGLDARRTLDALGLAGSFAGGLREYVAERAGVDGACGGARRRDRYQLRSLPSRQSRGQADRRRDHAHKFMSNCRPILGDQKCARVLQTVWLLGRSGDLKELYIW